MKPQTFTELAKLAADPGTMLVVNEAEQLVFKVTEYGRPSKGVSRDDLRALAADREAFWAALEEHDSDWIDQMERRALVSFSLGYLYARDPLKVAAWIAQAQTMQAEWCEAQRAAKAKVPVAA